jgi:hypothetical protein
MGAAGKSRNDVTKLTFGFVLLCIVAVLGSTGSAAEAVPDADLKIQGVFESSLPGTERKHSLRLIFHPRIGDLTRYDYLRTPIGLRYGLNHQVEIVGEVEAYFAHGLGDVKWFSKAGFSEAHAGIKYRLNDALYGWESAVGVDYTVPLGSPPTEITDGLTHVSPFVTFSRRLQDHPQWRLFWSLNADWVSDTDIVGRIRENHFEDDSAGVTGGFVWERESFHYTLEAGFATTRIFGGDPVDVYTFRPGVIWVVPRKFTARVGGQWMLGVGLHSSYGPDGTDIGASLKARISIDFKRWLRNRKTH